MKLDLRALLLRKPKKKPPVVKSWTGWFGVFNKFGHLSEIKPNRFAAQHAVATRGDGDECTIKPVRVIMETAAELPEHLQPKPKKTRKRKAKR